LVVFDFRDEVVPGNRPTKPVRVIYECLKSQIAGEAHEMIDDIQIAFQKVQVLIHTSSTNSPDTTVFQAAFKQAKDFDNWEGMDTVIMSDEDRSVRA
jgi:hypothetical protein